MGGPARRAARGQGRNRLRGTHGVPRRFPPAALVPILGASYRALRAHAGACREVGGTLHAQRHTWYRAPCRALYFVRYPDICQLILYRHRQAADAELPMSEPTQQLRSYSQP